MAPSQPRKNDKSNPETNPTGFSFVEVDYKGRVVALPEGRWDWKILKKHPYMAPYAEDVRQTVINPQVVLSEGIPGEEVFACYGFSDNKGRKRYLWVPISFQGDGSTGLVTSSYFVDELKPSVQEVVTMRWM